MPLTLDQDDGFLDVTVKTADGPVTVELDLFEANNTYAALCDRHDPAQSPVELGDAWAAWLATKGCPPLSHGLAFKLAGVVSDAVAEFKKKHAPAAPSPTPGSNASSASPSAE